MSIALPTVTLTLPSAHHISHIRVIDDKSAVKKTTYYQFQEPHPRETIIRLVTLIDKGGASVTKVMHNGDYSSYTVDSLYVKVINNYDISASSQKSEHIIFKESKEYYETNIRPNIVVPRWVLNIFNGTAEHETIYIDTDDFVVMPDPKWDRKKENIYLLALSKNAELYSLRDLRAEHISLLEEICRLTLQYIMNHYGIMEKYIRVFLHYYPSAWRLHVHFQHVSANISLGGNTQIGKAHLISTIVSNLKINTNYYRDVTIECVKCVSKDSHMRQT